MERLFAKIKKETLKPDEKMKVLSALQDFVDKNPAGSVESPLYIPSPWLSFVRQKIFIIPALVVIVVLSLTGGTVLAAKNSLPGNILYPVKLLNEKVQSLTAVGPKAQAQVHATQAISRLQEVEQMVSSNVPISTTTKQEIQNRFGTQAQAVTTSVEQLRNSGQPEEAAKIQSDFKSSIAKHQEAIIELSDDDSNQTQGEVRGVETSGGQTEIKQNTSNTSTERTGTGGNHSGESENENRGD